ncbi:GMC oxidoreductase [Novosphingobium sp. AP12]|uniref:GMC oxidoreductase n=1 Tax=Novosphingobium sp. AP12 TaxID=1144305 RepID=UPI000271E1D3|nr:GMC family oxidoreductase [Novosphingobium sp. AP12]EJL35379.1 choline dehydrogenase-like flavoprotein [Novosphingobium sp. AP12]
MRDQFDIVIIGSGAGGAPVAYVHARRKDRSVLVLEKGPLLRTQDEQDGGNLSDFKRDEMFNAGAERIINVPGMTNSGHPFFASHIEPDLNDEPHIFSDLAGNGPRVTIEGYTAQVVGGGTQLYGGVSLRFAETDFSLATFNATRTVPLKGDPTRDALRHVIDWPIAYKNFIPYYEKAERLVGINGTSSGQAKSQNFPFTTPDQYQVPRAPNPISLYAEAGMKACGFDTYRTPLAVITDHHAPSGRKAGDPLVGYVNRYGDPLGYKSSTWVSLLRPTIRKGHDLEVRPNCTVTHLVSNGRKVTEVHYRDESGRERIVRGTYVVVACSAIESVRLMMLSAEHDRTGFGKAIRFEESGSHLGRYFLTHAFGGAEVAIKRHRFDKSISLDSDFATDACAQPAFLDEHGLWAGGAIYNNTSDQCLPITLARTDGSTDLDTFWAGFSGDMAKRGDGIIDWLNKDFGTRLSVSFMANQVPRYDNRIELHPTLDKWGRKSAHIIKDWHPHDGAVMSTLAAVCEDILLAGVPGATRDDISEGSVYGNAVRVANHILGGMRFGETEAESVLDTDCRVWGFENLYVTDGAFMPTSGGGNPTLTIQANAFRVADLIP